MKQIKSLFIRDIPTKNYYIVFITSILLIVVLLYARIIYLNYKETIKNTSPFSDQSIKQIITDDLDFAMEETNEAFLYVSYTGDKNIYNTEKKLLREIKKMDLLDKFIYWDVTSMSSTNKYIEVLKNKFPDVQNNINSAPLLIYIKDGKAIEAISSDFEIVSYQDFDNIIKKYEIK